MWVYNVVIRESCACITEHTAQKIQNTRTIARALSESQFVYILPSMTKQEVCARLLQSLLTMTCHRGDTPQ